MEIRLRTKEQEQLVIDNYRLVGHIIKKFKSDNISQDDLFSVGTIGLIKAAISFDDSKSVKFSTYASKCISNEISIFLKKENRYYSRVVSLDAPVRSNQEELNSYHEIVHDINTSVFEQIEEKESVTKYINIALNTLNPMNRLIILYRISGMTFDSISKKFGVSKQNISQREKMSKEKIQTYLNRTKIYNKTYNMEIVDNLYTVSFSPNNVQNFNKIFAHFLQKQGKANNLSGLRVNYSKELVLLQVPAQPEFLALIAEIIREIDSYNLEFLGNKKIKISETCY